eukprot:scaffold20629_cov67-Phaeocystis_antarctica.AAC.3
MITESRSRSPACSSVRAACAVAASSAFVASSPKSSSQPPATHSFTSVDLRSSSGQRSRGGALPVLREVRLQLARQRLVHLGHDWLHLAAVRTGDTTCEASGGAHVATLQHTGPAATAEAVVAREHDGP